MKKNFKKGFTIIELIVVITIFSILVTVTLFNFAGFNESIALSNISQQIAIFAKKAQTAGSSGRLPAANLLTIALQTNPGWVPTYGVHFEKGSNLFCYFIDLDGSGNYTGGKGCLAPEGLESIALQANYQISDLRVLPGGSSVSSLDITYTRPNLSAVILAGGLSTTVVIEAVEIDITSPSGNRTKTISIHRVGQISIK